MRVALWLALVCMVGVGAWASSSYPVQPTKQMTEKQWNIVVTVFSEDKPIQYTLTTFGDESDCMQTARVEGDKHRDEGTVGIMCLDPVYFAAQQQ